MFLSFVIVSQNNSEKLMNTLISIKEQTDDDYEIVLVDDSGFQPKSLALEFMNEHFYANGKKIQVITNLRSQGFSYNLNTAIAVARGNYFMIVDEGEIVYKTAIAVLKANIAKHQVEHKQIDMVEFRLHYPHSKGNSEIRNKTNMLLSPKTDKEILAYTHPLIFTKIFRRKLILQKNIEFLNYRRTDAFFIYNILAKSNGFLAIDDILAACELGLVNYSVFDLLKQWIYIFNLYRDLNLYREYQEELEYAFLRFCLITFLRLVRLQNNKTLSIKAINSAENKLERRYKNFIKNKYIKDIKEPKFKIIVSDIKGFIKNWKLENTK